MAETTVASPRWIGQSVLRKEDGPLLRGEHAYVADLRDGTELHACVLRSSHAAHARILGIDTADATAMPGVVAVYTAKDLPQPVPRIPMRLWPLAGVERALQPVLATDRVRYVGEPIALIVAISRYLAEDARDVIKVDYEMLEPVIGLERATSATAARLHDDVEHNIAGTVSVRVGDATAAIAASPHVVEGRFRIHRHSGVPLETRGLVAAYDGVRLTMWGPTKVSHFNRLILAKLLNVDPSVIRFVEPAVGGGFGVRGEFYPEDYLLPFAAMRLVGRRIAWQEDRLEHLVSMNHSREQEHVARLAVDASGRIQALESDGSNSMGGYVRTHGATVATMGAIMLPGPYVVPNYACDIKCVLENKTPTGTYRGPGRFECNFVRERLVDMAARAVHQDPADFRRHNFIAREQMPYDLGIDVRMGELHVHQRYDSGDYRRQLDEALAIANYEGLKRRRREAQEDGRLVGLGLACFVEKSGIGAWEYARVELTPDGDVVVFTGLESVGQGIETSLAQIAGDALQIDLDRISVRHGDTDVVPRGLGAFASRGTMLGGGAVHLAALEAARRARQQAARLLGVPEPSVGFDGTVFTAGSRHVTLRSVAASVGWTDVDGVGRREGLCAEAVYESEELGYPYGLHLALVEIERRTGILHILKYLIAYDVGVAVNPLLVRGQLVGGFVQGLGGAVLEEFAYSDDGQPLFASFAEYMLPTAATVPPLDLLVTEHEPSTVHPLGVKGVGEGGTVAVAAALANAVSDAIGVEVLKLPLSPPRLLRLVRQAEAARSVTR